MISRMSFVPGPSKTSGWELQRVNQISNQKQRQMGRHVQSSCHFPLGHLYRRVQSESGRGSSYPFTARVFHQDPMQHG